MTEIDARVRPPERGDNSQYKAGAGCEDNYLDLAPLLCISGTLLAAELSASWQRLSSSLSPPPAPSSLLLAPSFSATHSGRLPPVPSDYIVAS